MCTYGTSVTTITSHKTTPDNIRPQLDNTTTAQQQLDNNPTVARQHISGQPLRPFFFRISQCDSCHDTVTDSADNRFVMWELSGLRYKHKVVFAIVLLLFVMWELSGIRFKQKLSFDLVVLLLPTQRIAAP